MDDATFRRLKHLFDNMPTEDLIRRLEDVGFEVFDLPQLQVELSPDECGVQFNLFPMAASHETVFSTVTVQGETLKKTRGADATTLISTRKPPGDSKATFRAESKTIIDEDIIDGGFHWNYIDLPAENVAQVATKNNLCRVA